MHSEDMIRRTWESGRYRYCYGDDVWIPIPRDPYVPYEIESDPPRFVPMEEMALNFRQTHKIERRLPAEDVIAHEWRHADGLLMERNLERRKRG